MNLETLLQKAIDHRHSHNCSAYPYEQGDKLVGYVSKYNPKDILEIGTGIGYTTALISLNAPEANILSIEKDLAHVEAARIYLSNAKAGKNIFLVNDSAEQYLGTVTKQFDFIFFDGYQIHYEFMPHYERLLKPGGILFLANNHLKSKTSDQFFEQLGDTARWKVLERFEDTTVSQKL